LNFGVTMREIEAWRGIQEFGIISQMLQVNPKFLNLSFLIVNSLHFMKSA
jgi:hypothetical protein